MTIESRAIEPRCATRLRAAVDEATPRLLALSGTLVGSRPRADAWSPIEILGHLIDSASNNHQRFVRAADQDDLVFDGYAQDAWVTRQRYSDAPWEDVVSLWEQYNRHLARVMASMPLQLRTRVHEVHNLNAVAWRTVPRDQPTTLDYFMNDYVDHLEHHLDQILS